jgi:hypothetical protein
MARHSDAHEALACACAAKQRAQIRAGRWQALYSHVLQEFRWMKHARFTRLGRKLDAAREALAVAERIESAAYVEWSKVNE